MTYDALDRLTMILASNDTESIVYVYRLDSDGKTIKPCLFKDGVRLELLDLLRDEYGGGDFKLLIRKRRTMVFGGEISVVTGRSRRV